MPGKHNENTKLLGFYAKRPLLTLVDETREGKGRSQFMREAAIEYMESRGVVVPADLKDAPDRVGKGGPRKYPPHKPSGVALNDSSSKLISEAKAISEKAEAAGAHQIPKSRRSRAARAPSGNTGRPSRGVSRGSKDKPFPPTQAPT